MKSSAKTGLKRCNNSFKQTKITACKQLHMYAHSARQVPESDVIPGVEWALARNGQAQKGEREGKRCVLCPSWHTGEARHARPSSCQGEGGPPGHGKVGNDHCGVWSKEGENRTHSESESGLTKGRTPSLHCTSIAIHSFFSRRESRLFT